MFVIKTVVGIGLIAGIYYMTNELFKEKPQQQPDGIEVEISLD